MPVLDVSFFGKPSGAGTGTYDVLVDQLQILEAQLAVDGKLSPGDYKLLQAEARKLYGMPGLSAAQRSNINVKIAQYGSQGSRTGLADTQDISRLDKEAEDDFRASIQVAGNNPSALLKIHGDVLQAKLASLAESIDQLASADDDYTAHAAAYNETLNQWIATREAITKVDAYQGGGQPVGDVVAYLTTNSSGEIVDVKFDRAGAKQGYQETNAVYGGMQVYGKVNRKENGKNIFVLGNETYGAADVLIPGADGTFKSSTLINSKNTTGGRVSIAQSGYVDVDRNSVRPQSYVPVGGWAQGVGGTFYQRNEDGSYTKFVNMKRDLIPAGDTDILPVPSTLEAGLNARVSKTVDPSTLGTVVPYRPGFEPGGVFSTVGSPAPTPEAQPTPTPTPGRTPAGPQQEPGASQPGVVRRTFESAKRFLGNLTGGRY